MKIHLIKQAILYFDILNENLMHLTVLGTMKRNGLKILGSNSARLTVKLEDRLWSDFPPVIVMDQLTASLCPLDLHKLPTACEDITYG